MLLVGLLLLALLVPSLRRGGLSGYDDALYAHEGREMASSGDWLTIRFNGGENFEYPPMFIWLEAASMRMFGFNDFAAKLPAAVFGFGTVLLVYFLALTLSGDPWLAITSMLALASTQFFLKYSAHAMTDVPFTFFFLLAITGYARGLTRPLYFLIGGAAIGCAVLTRSVIGLIPCGIILAHLLITKRFRLLRSPFLWLGLVVALSLPAAWFATLAWQHGAASVVRQVSFVGAKVSSNGSWTLPGNMFEYFRSIPRFYLPWFPVMLLGLWTAGRRAVKNADSASWLLLIWVALVLLPFSLVETKFARYLLPAFPAFSILSAVGLNRWLPERRRHAFFVVGLIGLAGALVYTELVPAQERAMDMRPLAPLAEAQSRPGERVVLYTYGEQRWDLRNQFVWYARRNADLLTDLKALVGRCSERRNVTAVVDSGAFEKLVGVLSPEAKAATSILGRSESFVCFRVSRGDE
jgi:4-amino-4-deoxy-L-arabinose transferase-like glycosyltransferase